MQDILYVLIILVVAVVIIAYLVRMRGDTKLLAQPGGNSKPYKSKLLRLSNIALIVALLLLVIGFLMLRSIFLLWISIGVLLISLIVGHFIKSWK